MEPMSAEESARSTAYDALLLDLFDETSGAEPVATTSMSAAACDDVFVDFQADLDALDAMFAEEGLSIPPSISMEPMVPLIKQEDETTHSSAASEDADDDTTSECATDGQADAVSVCSISSSAASEDNIAAAAAVVVVAVSTATESVKKPKSAPGGNNARKRQREELRVLRESAVKLEKALKSLKTKAKQSPPPTNSSLNTNARDGGRNGPDTFSPDQKVPRRWTPQPQHQHQSSPKGPFSTSSPSSQHTSESLLAKDAQARRITELENIHLSKLVNDHMKVAQQFEKVLRKQRPLTPDEILMETTTVTENIIYRREMSAISLPHTAVDTREFEVLEKNIDTRYHELERVFQAAGLAECRTNVREAKVDASREEGVLLTFKSSRLIPFDVEVINDTAIKLARSNFGNGPGVGIKRTGTTVAFKKQFQVGDMTINARGVSKRYMETDRIVIIWDGVSEWPSKTSGEIVSIEEKGWGIIQPFPQSKSSSSAKKNHKNASPLSLLQSYIYMTPGPTKDGAKPKEPQPEHVAILSDVVMPLYQNMFATRIQHLENVLVEDSLKRRLVAS